MRDLAILNPLKFESDMKKKNEVVSLQYLKNFLNKEGYSVDIYDFEVISDIYINKTLEFIAKNYCIIGISCYYPYIPLTLAEYLKKINSKLFIFAGGPMASLKYKELLYEKSPVDLVAINEGEWTLLDIVKRFFNKEKIFGIEGTAICNNGKIEYISRKFEEKIDVFSFPYREKNYFKRYIPTIISSRGCNGNCMFCSTRYTGYWRGRSPSNVFKEIYHITIEHKQNYFQFVEPNFLEDSQRAHEIADNIKSLPHKVYFDFACRIDSICKNPDVIMKLKDAGAVKVLIGIENFSDTVLKRWKKDVTCNDIETAIDILNKQELCYSASFILFHPETTIEELIHNIKKIENLKMYNNIEKLFNKLILIPGTKMNIGTSLQEWDFEYADVKEIYNKCSVFQKRNDYIMNNLEDFIFTSENSISNLLFLFDLCINKKCNEFFYLKSLVMKSQYVHKTDYLIDKIMYINSRVIIEKQIDNNYLCISTTTGLIYEISKNIYNFMKNIHTTKMKDLCHEIINNHKSKSEDIILVIKYVVILLKEELLIIKGEKNE